MRRASFVDMNCSVAQGLEQIGEWWTMLILRDALLGVRRFEDFQSRLGIARNILSARLDTLVGHGIMERRPYSERSARHEYVLTEKGRDLAAVVVALTEWGDRWLAPDGPPGLYTHSPCGGQITLVTTCANCGRVHDPAEIKVRPGPGIRTT